MYGLHCGGTKGQESQAGLLVVHVNAKMKPVPHEQGICERGEGEIAEGNKESTKRKGGPCVTIKDIDGPRSSPWEGESAQRNGYRVGALYT